MNKAVKRRRNKHSRTIDKRQPLSHRARRKFMDLIKETDPDRCWQWEGSVMRGDYPVFYGDGKQMPATRILYRLYYKNHLGKDWVIRHTCNTNLCMNPNHIYADKRAEASKETQLARRHETLGERHPQAQLTAQDVKRIRRLVAEGSKTQKELAEEYKVSKAHISNIVNRKTWTHI